uniref:Protein W02B12.13, isoform b n=1 Tax=Haemonchus contortus TaxID=6289 RepID=W6NCZ6_HAECO
MAGILAIVCVYLFVRTALSNDSTLGSREDFYGSFRDPFSPDAGLRRPSRNIVRPKPVGMTKEKEEEVFTSSNGWGFEDQLTEWPAEEERRDFSREPTKKVQTTTTYYEEIDPNRNGLLKDIGSINVGFGVGVGVPGNDPVKVGARVGVGFGESGLAGQLPIGQDIYPRQGQFQSLNDYDGDKSNIVPDRARKYWQAVREGRIRIPHYRPAPSLVGVGGNVGIGTAA